MPTAEIITIGTELLLGETVDTNTRHIARTLRGLGIDLYRTQTVGDNAGRIAQTVREAIGRAEIVITTGGLGPTVDDPTRQALAEAAGVELEFHPELWEQIKARIARYGRTPTENQKRQAYIPKGAIIIENPVGTAPAFIIEIPLSALTPSPRPPSPPPTGEGKGVATQSPGEGVRAVVTLPGVPREMETLLADAVVPYLQQRYSLHEVIQVRSLHVSGIGEGALDDQIGDMETLANPTVGLTAHSGVVDVRIAAKAGTQAEAGRMIAQVEQDLRARLGDNLFGADDETLEGVTLAALARRGRTLACLECGLDGALLDRMVGAGNPAYRGGRRLQVCEGPLAEASGSIQQEFDAVIGLGISLSVSDERQEISIVALMPGGLQERHLTYGGHPKSAARWAVNSALDWLRRIALAAS